MAGKARRLQRVKPVKAVETNFFSISNHPLSILPRGQEEKLFLA